ncbi:MAG: peroxide stress protein YaaA [Robiginitomaculum sp.]|nr:peroxide stress protein YaaA [Robiginitomaculum sp.]
MLAVLSPAKKLDLEPVDYLGVASEPSLGKHTEILARAAKKLSVCDLQDLMKLSDNLAKLNAERFKAFRLNGRSNSSKPAMLTFNGNVYEGLDAGSMLAVDVDFAQDHVRILSGLYGVLKPMDKIQPYRLEMGRKLATERGANLYQFWGATIAETLMADMADHKDKTIINLASNEYFKAVDKKTLTAPVIEAKFLNIKDGEARNWMFFGKKARGLMARWIVDNRIDTADDVRGFNVEGYKYVKSRSTPAQMVFTRKQPPPPSKKIPTKT